jgi:hypothetical protein
MAIVFLHRISELPFDADAEIFQQYPAFKLGVMRSVRHYAELLLPQVRELIDNSPYSEWVITAPPLKCQTPAAANLLCQELYRIDRKLSLIELQYDTACEEDSSQDYAQLDFATRMTERERLVRGLTPDTRFRGRPILFINDICVTGAQQKTLQQYFDRVEAASVTWLYLIFVDPEVGKAKPQIEWEINSLPFEELLRLVSTEEITFTGKCVQRVMHLSTPEREQVLRALNPDRRQELLDLALRNGFSHG